MNPIENTLNYQEFVHMNTCFDEVCDEEVHIAFRDESLYENDEDLYMTRDYR